MSRSLVLAARVGFVVALVAGYFLLTKHASLRALAEHYWFVVLPLIGGPVAFAAAKLFPGLEDSQDLTSLNYTDLHD